MAQLIEALTTNHDHGSSPGCANLTMGTLKIHLCPSRISQVLKLPGSVSLNVVRNASLRITLTVPEVVDTENWVTSPLPIMLDPLRRTADYYY